MEEHNFKMKDMESIHNKLIDEIREKEREIMSLKIYNSRDDSKPFEKVASTHRGISTDKPKTDTRPHVTIIGTSNTNGIDPRKLSSRYTANKITAYTISEAETEIQNLTPTPDVIVLHSITNDIKTDTPVNCVNKMSNLVKKGLETNPQSKIIISLPTPRSDDSTHNNNSQIISAMLKEQFKDHDMISLCG